VLAERGGEPGQGTGAAWRAVLALEPGHGGKAYAGLIGQLLLRQAVLAAQLPEPLAVQYGCPPPSRTRAP
jgi:hypothetical protein